MSCRLTFWLLISVLIGPFSSASSDVPDQKVHPLPQPITENVGVRLIPVDVGVWPKDNNP